MRWNELLVLLLIVVTCLGQDADTQPASGPETMPNPTPKPHELSTSVLTPQEYKPGPYTDLRQELHAQAHSRITATLKPGFDVMAIMLELLQWNEQDVEQVWIRPADHVDQASYDITEPSGLETAIQDLLRKVRFATLEEIFDHYTFNKRPDEHADMHGQVSAALQHLISGGAVILNDNMYYPSFQQPGNYKLDLSGDVNMLRHPVVHALQQHPGIAHAQIDEHFIRDKHPAWYEIWAFPRN